MPLPSRFELTRAERESALWKKLMAYFESELGRSRKQNDVVQDIDSTNALRGDIRRLKKIVALNEPQITTLTGRPESGVQHG